MHKQAYIHLLPRGALETQNVGGPKQNFKTLAFLKLNFFKTVAASHKCVCFSDPLACLFTISLPMSPSTSCILSQPSSSTRTRDLSISLHSTNLGALEVEQSAPLQRLHDFQIVNATSFPMPISMHAMSQNMALSPSVGRLSYLLRM
jgi:hypothetical protein